MKKKLIPVIFCLVVGVIFVGFGSSIALGKTLLIGGDAPLSGPAASWGIGQMRGVQMAIDEVNAKGGLTINGENIKLKLICYDNKAQANEALSIAKKLVYSDKVKYIMVAAVGATGRAIQTVTAPNNVYFSFSCWGKMLVGPKVPLNFRVGFSPYEMSDAYLQAIKKIYPKAKTIATISPNDTSGWDGAKGDIRAAEKIGIKCVAEEYYERDQQDFHATLTRILAKKPDILDLATSPMSTGGVILKQAYELGYRGPKAWNACSMASRAVAIAGVDASEDLYLCVNWNYSSPKFTLPALREVIKKYNDTYKEDWDYYGVCAYAVAPIVFATMQKIQSTDPVKVTKAMVANQPYNTFLGPIVFGNSSVYGVPHAMLHPLVLSRVHKGQIENMSFGLHDDLAKAVGDWKFPD